MNWLTLLQQFLFLVCTAELLQLRVSEGKVVGECRQQVEGSRCHGRKKPWQHDGVCYLYSHGQKCIVPDSRTFKFAVVARLRQLKRIPGSPPVKSLWMRGHGPGLSWEKSIELKKSASAIDVWRAELTYQSDSDALRCLSATHCTANQGAMEFRLYRDRLGQDSMLGPNFYIPLPLSNSMFGAADFLMPEVTVYPWFDGDMITKSHFIIKSSIHVTGRESELQFNVTLLYPPSFDYNIRKTYPLVLIFGRRETALVAPLLEHMYSYEASIQEAMVVFIDYKEEAPFCLFSPFKHSLIWRCKGDQRHCHSCQSCWDPARIEPCDREEFVTKTRRCLKAVNCGGRAGAVLNLIELDLLPALLERTANRIQVDFPRDRLSIIGYSGAGLLACFAAVTRPLVYGNAGCLSAPFTWPIKGFKPRSLTGMYTFFPKLVTRIQQQPGLRMQYFSQKYFIDVGEQDSASLPVVDSHISAETFITLLQTKLKLQMNRNIMFASVPNMGKSYYHHPWGGTDVLHRLKYPLLYFLRAEGGPNKDYSRILKITEESYGERAGKLPPAEETMSSDSADLAVNWLNNSGHCSVEYTRREASKKSNDVPLSVFLSTLGELMHIYCDNSVK